ncbi:ankyrin repeat domain-containing protein [Sungkyunkwania multivorans]|uniref:Ankyrin repeat domain-containing protein n=1 Tax=Sungkyunkwania multivorans TaxID=1173618 RepID=A0ABW3D042_9FLAO
MKKLVVMLVAFAAFTTVGMYANDTTSDIETNAAIFAPKVNSFCMAIAKGDVATVKKMIELGEDVNRRSNGMTPSMYAARYNHVDILELLIANGANLKTKCSRGHTALKYAQLSNAENAAEVIKKELAKKKKR